MLFLIDLNILSEFEFRPIGGASLSVRNIFNVFKNKKVQELFPAPYIFNKLSNWL